MGLFVCDVCHTIENTSFGIYWERNENNFDDASLQGKALCSACAPEQYADGNPTTCHGKWHGRFARVVATEKELLHSGLINFVYLGPFEHLRPKG